MAAAIRVLYVDDEPALLDIGKLFLERSGDFSVTTVTSVPDAIRLLEQEQFDTIISDYQMPEMDGIKFLVLVRTRFGMIPFILFTGKGREEVVIEALNAGADGYLQKGSEPQSQFAELSHKIKQATSRKKAEEALRESEEKYQAIVDHALEAIMIIDSSANVLFANPAAATLVDLEDSSACIGKNALEIIAPESREAARVDLASSRDGRDGYIAKYKIITATARERWVELIGKKIAFGGVPSVIVMFRDITERKRMDDALRESEERHRILLNEFPDPIFSFYPDGTYRHVNRAFAEGVGKSVDQIIGKKIWDVFPKDEADKRFYALRTVFSTGEGKEIEVHVPRFDGDRDYVTTIVPVKDDKGSVVSAICSSKDVTERKRAEEALRASEEMFKSVVHNSSDLTILANAKGIVTFVSPQCDLVTGYPSDKFIGQTIPDIIYPDDVTRCRHAWEQVVQLGQEQRDFEYRIVDGAGAVRWVSHSTKQVTVDGRVLGIQSDICNITERKRMEEALSESERRFRELSDLLPQTVYEIDVNGILTYGNRIGFELFGYTENEFKKGLNVLQMIAPHDRERAGAAFRAIIDGLGRRGVSNEYQALKKDGSTFPISIYSSAIIVQGRITGLRGIIIDNTERKQVEEALVESEERYHLLAEHMTDIVWLMDMDIKTTYQSPSSEKLRGYTSKEIKDLPPEKNLTPESLKLALEVFFAEMPRIEGDPNYNPVKILELEYYRKDGTTFWSESKFSIIRDSSGKPVSILGEGRDITVRKQVEKQLWENEEKFRLIVENSHDIIYILTTDGVFTFVSPAWTTLLGHPLTEVIGQSFQKFVHPDDIPQCIAFLQYVIGTGQRQEDVEYRVQHTDGTWRWHSSSAVPLKDETGRIIGGEGIARDITERQLMESEIRSLNTVLEQRVEQRTAQLNASLEDKTVLLQEIHHRVKNNLQIIISLLKLQSRYIDDDKTRQVLQESQNRLRAMALVHERIYRSNNISEINLKDYLSYLTKQIFSFSNIPPYQIGMKITMEDIMSNIDTLVPVGLIVNELVSNSLKHAFPDGRKGEISIAIQRQNALLTILFADTGIGIPANLDWRNAESLGLRLVILLVEQLDGTIELDRSSGTAFTIVVKEKK